MRAATGWAISSANSGSRAMMSNTRTLRSFGSSVSMCVGITREELLFLVRQFANGGLEAVGLVRSQRKSIVRDSARGYPTIEKTTGVCGGAARVSGTRIPVWQLVAAREAGASEGQLLLDFPRLEARNLVDAWAYAADHPEEIRAQIHANEVA